MRKLGVMIASAAITLAPAVHATAMEDVAGNSKPCATIASACLGAGFTREENADKKFWQDCMKPLLLGESVQGVSVDAGVVKECRNNKIIDLKKELSELQRLSPNS